MHHRISGRKNLLGRRLVLSGCLFGAAVLLIAAFMQDEGKDASAGWVPLNEAVRESLDELKAEHEAEGQAAEQEQADRAAGSSEPGQGNQADGVTDNNAQPVDETDVAPNETEADQKDDAVLTSRDESGRLDLNRATAEELDELKGIGPSKAQAIVEDRERNGFFASVKDLLRVKGIGEKLLAGVKESVVTRP